MNYYPHHIGDFDRDTRHLTRLERSVYRDLMDVYYDTESQLTLDFQALCRKILARSNDEATAVEQVLNEFFTKTPTGWYHERCEKELEAYRSSTSQKSLAGKASAAKRALNKLQALNVPSTSVEQTLNGNQTNQEPRTKNQEPIEKQNTPIPPEGGKQKRKSAISLKAYLAECKAEGINPIPEGDPVFEYIEKVGIPHEFLRLQWMEFKERYSMPDAKRYKSWRTVFLKSVKANWFKIWYVQQDGSYVLTTVGQQADRQHKDAA